MWRFALLGCAPLPTYPSDNKPPHMLSRPVRIRSELVISGNLCCT